MSEQKKIDAYIFDMDGTLAINNGHRGYCEWNKVGFDSLNTDVARVLLRLKPSAQVIIVTGREDVCENDTSEWLTNNGIPYNGLLMRKAGDRREDVVVKKELYNNHVKDKFNVLGVFDDRNSVVSMWRELGLTCFQVANGNY